AGEQQATNVGQVFAGNESVAASAVFDTAMASEDQYSPELQAAIEKELNSNRVDRLIRVEALKEQAAEANKRQEESQRLQQLKEKEILRARLQAAEARLQALAPPRRRQLLAGSRTHPARVPACSEPRREEQPPVSGADLRRSSAIGSVLLGLGVSCALPAGNALARWSAVFQLSASRLNEAQRRADSSHAKKRPEVHNNAYVPSTANLGTAAASSAAAGIEAPVTPRTPGYSADLPDELYMNDDEVRAARTPNPMCREGQQLKAFRNWSKGGACRVWAARWVHLPYCRVTITVWTSGWQFDDEQPSTLMTLGVEKDKLPPQLVSRLPHGHPSAFSLPPSLCAHPSQAPLPLVLPPLSLRLLSPPVHPAVLSVHPAVLSVQPVVLSARPAIPPA
ncbi:hypothetical protein CYMTET_34771, partial [Cymbomonas tetramitiformis]